VPGFLRLGLDALVHTEAVIAEAVVVELPVELRRHRAQIAAAEAAEGAVKGTEREARGVVEVVALPQRHVIQLGHVRERQRVDIPGRVQK